MTKKQFFFLKEIYIFKNNKIYTFSKKILYFNQVENTVKFKKKRRSLHRYINIYDNIQCYEVKHRQTK